MTKPLSHASQSYYPDNLMDFSANSLEIHKCMLGLTTMVQLYISKCQHNLLDVPISTSPHIQMLVYSLSHLATNNLLSFTFFQSTILSSTC